VKSAGVQPQDGELSKWFGSFWGPTESVMPSAACPCIHLTKYWAYAVSMQGHDTNLSPTIDAISVVRNTSRQSDVGSLKNRIPTAAVPKAPIPVQTA
jgi:hypothetical protein